MIHDLVDAIVAFVTGRYSKKRTREDNTKYHNITIKSIESKLFILDEINADSWNSDKVSRKRNEKN